ncbi:MAG TPA: hypothetical protein VK619_10430 [Pyrinomonadaceae bacterium]|nr:hypothetical protein [Pyrinomonadaceae bacterium]
MRLGDTIIGKDCFEYTVEKKLGDKVRARRHSPTNATLKTFHDDEQEFLALENVGRPEEFILYVLESESGDYEYANAPGGKDKLINSAIDYMVEQLGYAREDLFASDIPFQAHICVFHEICSTCGAESGRVRA